MSEPLTHLCGALCDGPRGCIEPATILSRRDFFRLDKLGFTMEVCPDADGELEVTVLRGQIGNSITLTKEEATILATVLAQYLGRLS